MIGYIRELFGGVGPGAFHQVAVDGLMALLIVVCAVAAYYVTRVLLQVIERLILRAALPNGTTTFSRRAF